MPFTSTLPATSRDSGSIAVTLDASALVSQTASSPALTSRGLAGTFTRSTTRSVLGSITTIWLSVVTDTHSSPAA